MNGVLLYTWKDVERKLLLNKEQWKSVIADIETYTDEITIYLKENSNEELAVKQLKAILKENYDCEKQKIGLDLSNGYLSVIFEAEEDSHHTDTAIPLFRHVLYQQSAYYSELIHKELPGVPVIAFHSYKGGVGRTLSLLAFVKAWSALKDLKDKKRLLIVDADIEAPGITWLTSGRDEAGFSFLDLLEVTQEKKSVDEIIALIADVVSELTIRIETDKTYVEHIVLPTYRYIEQLLDMYASPESLALSYNKKYILAEVLSELGRKVNAEFVLVDLRAGLSEFSAPLLFDPRVKKYLVTSTSYQSVKGTEILLHQLSKGLPLNENTKIPEILLTMGQENIDTIDIISELTAVFDKYMDDHALMPEDGQSLTDDIVTELPFASELVHLTSLQKIMKSLNGKEFYKNIFAIVQNSYFGQKETRKGKLKREEAIKLIHDFAVNQITAEGNHTFAVLMTNPIQNLMKKYKHSIPNTVIMGAKGSGKTFLYREILRNQFWEKFVFCMDKNKIKNTEKDKEGQWVMTVPLLASGNAGGFYGILEQAIQNYNQCSLQGKIEKTAYLDNRNYLMECIRKNQDRLAWKEIWERLILNTVSDAYASLDELEKELEEKGKKVVFLIDGLEEIFMQTITSENEKNAVAALCIDVISEIKVKYNHFGLMIFLRKDMARDAVTVNFEQFNSLYHSVELQWSSTEALRLAVWLVSKAVPHFYQEEAEIEMAPREVLDQALNALWGVKLGKPTSNEANASRWILAALSDFNGQLQARDIIRFLAKATISPGKEIYPDRYLMPKEIKKAVSECSIEKISEIKQEIKALAPIFDKLENAPSEKKILPFYQDHFNLSQAEEKIMKQEGFLRTENEKYYLSEIIRHALKFKYAKGARPKVLSLLLK